MDLHCSSFYIALFFTVARMAKMKNKAILSTTVGRSLCNNWTIWTGKGQQKWQPYCCLGSVGLCFIETGTTQKKSSPERAKWKSLVIGGNVLLIYLIALQGSGRESEQNAPAEVLIQCSRMMLMKNESNTNMAASMHLKYKSTVLLHKHLGNKYIGFRDQGILWHTLLDLLSKCILPNQQRKPCSAAEAAH